MRLIDADALLEELRKSCKWHAENSRELSLLQRDINIAEEQPTVEAKPVRQGKWIQHTRTDLGWLMNDMIECSECGCYFSGEVMVRRSYCPNCGSDMRGTYVRTD